MVLSYQLSDVKYIFLNNTQGDYGHGFALVALSKSRLIKFQLTKDFRMQFKMQKFTLVVIWDQPSASYMQSEDKTEEIKEG